ncbi:hypothetical protein GWK47_016044 [Chionoecetes opilio]|uniref:Uncharacterized protein n=1 Tax=Chionoecetes opilio TaxID=41210 RepID=A0A8J4XTQ4_CHIOP|nr:hypothetical protein GWK47_016044 [Chionoecetes opilio]
MIRRCGHSTPQLSQLPRDQCLLSDDYTAAKYSSVDRYGVYMHSSTASFGCYSIVKRKKAKSIRFIFLTGEPQSCNAEDEVGGATQGIRASSSLVDWESPKAPLNLRDHQIQWKRRRQDSRLIRAYQEPSIEEEEFSCTHPENTSPFTKLVGDCERPSLAPMTPHSRHNVSEIKMSLREQMEKLYRN